MKSIFFIDIIYMDIRRILDGEKYYYIDSKSRKRIKNKRTVKRIQKLNIPPGYKKGKNKFQK